MRTSQQWESQNVTYYGLYELQWKLQKEKDLLGLVKKAKNVMIDWFGGMKLEINYPKLIILRD